MKIAVTATPSASQFAPILLRGTIAETFRQAAECSFDAIEIHLRSPADVNWDELISLSEHYRLPVTAIGTGMAARMDGLSFTDDDPDVRKQAVGIIGEYCKLGSLLKAGVILGSINGKVGKDPQAREIRRSHHFDCLMRCEEIANYTGTRFYIEPLNRYESDWLNTGQDVLTIIHKIGSDRLRYLADTFHMNIEEGDFVSSIKRSGSHLGYVHLADSNRQVPGHGHISVHNLLNTLVGIGYDGVLSFECLPKPDWKQASTDGVRYVREILSEIFGKR